MLEAAHVDAPGQSEVDTFIASVESRLKDLTDQHGDNPVDQSIRYTLLGRGNRTRAILIGLSTQAWHGQISSARDAACAVEMVHAASLILDDLPMMDDACQRRGRSTNHRVFGEHCAVLASFALVCEAFRVVASDGNASESTRTLVAKVLSQALGPSGLVAGQMRDLAASTSETNPAEVEETYRLKTAVLFAASTELGAIVAQAGAVERQLAYRFGMEIGMAFQTYDDLADQTASSESLGKDVLADNHKPTLARLHGPAVAERIADERITLAVETIADRIGREAGLLTYIAQLQRALKQRMRPSVDRAGR
ncbi:MAG: polyprenyl synthetase family protein [Pseudomonadota bacterium]